MTKRVCLKHDDPIIVVYRADKFPYKCPLCDVDDRLTQMATHSLNDLALISVLKAKIEQLEEQVRRGA